LITAPDEEHIESAVGICNDEATRLYVELFAGKCGVLYGALSVSL
jgi:hypothetical protein